VVLRTCFPSSESISGRIYETSSPTILHLAAGAAALQPYRVLQAPKSWPSGPVKIVVPFAPGGSADVIARLAQPGLQQRLRTTIIIENRTGGSATIGAAVVAKSAPDGNTWLLDFDNHAANPFTIPNLPYDTRKISTRATDRHGFHTCSRRLPRVLSDRSQT